MASHKHNEDTRVVTGKVVKGTAKGIFKLGKRLVNIKK
jgi:hypothetical protein